MKSYVIDTSAIVEKVVSKEVEKGKIKGKIIIPHAAVAELEHQANLNRETGFLGLEELQLLQELKKKGKIELEFLGNRPTEFQIKQAKSGEIDASIRELAYQQDATLITADRVLAESGKAFNLDVIFIEQKKPSEKITIEKFFDNKTMSLHLKEKTTPKAKKGKPGEFKLEEISKTKLTREALQDMSKEIVEKAQMDRESFIEISRKGSTVVQYKDFRIVIVKPPIADGWEITAIKPIKKLKLEDYNLDPTLLERIKTRAHGVVISGETGSGKSTLAQAIGEFYVDEKKVVKTIESPRDLKLRDEVTQYSKNFTTSEEIHDILFLSRPDNLIFDEVRDTPDFKLYIDLRLGGANCIGVLHAATPIDSIQRFISRLDTGMIPSVLDTIIFMESGKVKRVLTLRMIVKVPSGMQEADLARPVVEILDFFSDELLYEIYSYGEETVVIPVQGDNTNPITELARKQLEIELKKYAPEAEVELPSTSRAILHINPENIASIIGRGGSRIEQIEKKLGISITVKELKKERSPVNFKVSENKKALIFIVPKSLTGQSVAITIDNQFLCAVIPNHKGEIKINKRSALGKEILNALDTDQIIELHR
tara:strand:+ start:1924 stop:3714 length:1791 start_codon:yes stop_codon:yes gene_type:complete